MNRPAAPRFAAAAVALLAAAGAWAQPSLGQVFTCVDNNGRTLTSDRLIAQCMDREQRLLAKDGTLIRIVPPQLTADERAEKDMRDKRIAAEKQAKAEAVRRDRLLLERYPDPAAHERAREAALDDMRAATRLSQAQQQAEMQRVIKRFDEELAQLKRLWAGAAPGSSATVAAAAPEPAKAAKPIKPTTANRQ